MIVFDVIQRAQRRRDVVQLLRFECQHDQLGRRTGLAGAR